MRFPLLILFLQAHCGVSFCQETPAVPAPDVMQLIAQLGDAKVRLRDAAQAALENLGGAELPLEEAAKSHPSEDARLRAKAILKFAKENAWTLDRELEDLLPKPGVPTTALVVLRGIKVSSDQQHFVTLHMGGAAVWDAKTFKMLYNLGAPSTSASEIYKGLRRSFDISLDGTLLVSGDQKGAIYVDKLPTARVKIIPGPTPVLVNRMMGVMEPIPAGSSNSADPFAPDPTQRMVQKMVPTSNPAGLPNWVLQFNKHGTHILAACHQEGPVVHEVATEAPPVKLQNSGNNWLSCRSRDGEVIAVVADNALQIRNGDTFALVQTFPLVTRQGIESMDISPDNLTVACGASSGNVSLLSVKTGSMTSLAEIGSPCHGITYAPDGRTLWATGVDGVRHLTQLSTATGEVLWMAPPDEKGSHGVAMLNANTVLESCTDCKVRVWTKRSTSIANR